MDDQTPEPEPHPLDAAASDALDAATADVSPDPAVTARISEFRAVGDLIRDVPVSDGPRQRAQIDNALARVPVPVTPGTGSARTRVLSIAAALVLVAGVGAVLVSGLSTSDDEGTTTEVADAAPAPRESTGAASSADEADAVIDLGRFATIDDLIEAYHDADPSAPSGAQDAIESGAVAEAATFDEAPADRSTRPDAAVGEDSLSADTSCAPDGVVANGIVADRSVVIVASTSGGDTVAIFIDDCSVVPVPSSP